MKGFKSEENKNLFIQGMKDDNFTQDEIDAKVRAIEGSTAQPEAAPIAQSAPPSVKKEDAVVAQPSPFALNPNEPAQNLKAMDQAREEQGKTLVNNLTPTGGFFPPSKENWPVYAIPAAAAAVTAAGIGLKSRFFGPEKEAVARVEPTSSDRLPAAAQQPTTHEQWIANLSPEEKTLYERSEEAKAARANALEATRTEPVFEPESPVVAPQTPEQIRQAKQAAAAQAAQQSMVAAPPPESAPLQKVEPPTERPANPKVSALLQPPMAGAVVPEPTVPVEPVATPTTPAEPVATTTETPVAPVATDAERVQALKALEEPAVKATNEKVLETIKSTAQTSLGKPDLVTGTGMPAYQGQGDEGSKLAHKKGVFESVKQIPKEYVFVPTGQNMDIVRNAVGQPEYTKNLKSSGGYPESPQAAYEQSRNINKSLGRATMAEAKASGIPLPEPTPSITQKIAGSKTVRVAGVTGALILASDLASAAQEGITAAKQGDRQMATGSLTDILGALTGPVGFTASQLLGTSPEELRTLRAAEQAKKAGAGRGVASPSAYQR